MSACEREIGHTYTLTSSARGYTCGIYVAIKTIANGKSLLVTLSRVAMETFNLSKFNYYARRISRKRKIFTM